MQFGIIPNDVNGNFIKFKIMLYSLIEGFVLAMGGNRHNQDILESSRYKERQINFFLDFVTFNNEKYKRLIFKLNISG